MLREQRKQPLASDGHGRGSWETRCDSVTVGSPAQDTPQCLSQHGGGLKYEHTGKKSEDGTEG